MCRTVRVNIYVCKVVNLRTPLVGMYSSVHVLFIFITYSKKGYRVVSSTVDLCVDNVLHKVNRVIHHTMNLWRMK